MKCPEGAVICESYVITGVCNSAKHERLPDEHDQPMPTPNDGPIVQELVLEDIRHRLEIGIQRYGTGLQAGNGRDMLRDAYEEALDLAIYLRGCLLERDGA